MEKVKINATLEWAFLSTPNEMSGKYQVDLCNLSEGAVGALKGLGITVQYKDAKPEKGYYITCKSAIPIRAYDENGVVIPVDTLVGNGSKATCIVGYYDWTFKNKKGRSPSIQKMVINDLIVYGGVADEADGVDAL